MKKNKAFTLVELLAVIVILAIILAIAVPAISGIIGSATRGAFESDAKMVLQQYEYKKLENSSFEYSGISSLGLSDTNYTSIDISEVDGNPYVLIVGKNKWAGLKACGTIRSINVVSISDIEHCVAGEAYTDYVPSEGVNKPKLATGMIPVKWSTDHWVTTTESDANWYSYTTTDKQWANVIQVSNPSSYATSGTTVDVANDVIAMWVWIPRYVYNISAGWHEQMTSTTAGTIQVQFSMDTDDTRDGTVTLVNTGSANDSDGQWTNHPAFKFGDDQVTGIWVAKFEASNDGSSNINVKPNVSSWRSITVNDIFNTTRAMETNTRYGWNGTGSGIDTHMMKNIEWGAVAYLTQSTYGINGNIGINNYYNSGTYRTGCGSAPGSSPSTTCNTYDTTGMLASTTGNIYGIYDMSGGAFEYVAGYINNLYADGYGASLVSDNAKYKDIYTPSTADTEEDWDNAYIDNYALAINHKGDAVYETSYAIDDTNWYGDYAYMPSVGAPWFVRGGCYDGGSDAGVFDFNGDYGSDDDNGSFRPVVLVGTGL